MSASSLNAVKNKAPTPSLGEMLWPWMIGTMKTTWFGFVSILTFICAPIWNSKERMRQLTHFLLFSFLGLILLWAAFWVGQQPVFSITQIQLQGENGQNLKHMNPALLRTQVLQQLNGNFFSMRLDQTRKVFEELPWVRSASVRRVWPNNLLVTIQEQEPVGIWHSNEGPKLINAYGELFTVNLAEVDPEKKLIEFSGPLSSNKEAMELYQQLDQWFKPLEAKVVSLSLSSRYSWTTRLDNGMSFELGRDLDQKDRSQMKNRLERFYKVWPEVKEKLPNKVDYIDLRYANGFAVRTLAKGDSNTTKTIQTSSVLGNPAELLSSLQNPDANLMAPESSHKKNKADFKKSKLVDGRKSE